MISCKICNAKLTGQQKLYCSNKCKNKSHSNCNYENQKRRSLKRKLAFIEKRGGSCEECNYSKNLAALVFHHVNPKSKSFELDARNLSNRSLLSLEKELDKCRLLCANCHAETHNPKLDLTKISFETDALTN